jgi:CubicO group peptidase (beta-lactamase class C family)
LTASVVLLVAGAGPAGAVDRSDVQRAVEVLTGQMDSVGVPGAAFAVVDRAGDTVVGGLGNAGGGRTVSADTPFVIGSTSKSFTALAVMQLVDDGRVELDAPVRRYVPELELQSPEADAITVQQILQQTSGLPESAGGPVLKSAKDGTALDAVRELRDTRLASPPGRQWHYSNANYVLAGLVVERASGLSYADHVERRIFTPLGMTASTTRRPVAQENGGPDVTDVSPGHRLWFGATIANGPTWRPGLLAAGYLVSTASDMGRYLRMYLRDGLSDDGTRIVSTEGLRTMTSPGPTARLGSWADGAPARYAMGWFVGGPWREPVLFHPGNTPDSSAMITVLPGRGLAAATLMNLSHELPVPGSPAAPDRISRNVIDALLGEPVDTGPSTTGFYAVFDLVALLLVGAAGWGLWRAVTAARRRRAPRHTSRAVLGVILRAGAIVLLLATPPAIGYDWAIAWLWAPDLTLTLALLIALLVCAAALRLQVLLPRRRTRRVPGSGPPNEAAVDASASSAATGPGGQR